jgi:dTDP-4-dehydrorhamnose reductase
MRLLLTGASGHLGAYLLRHLVATPGIEVSAWSGSSRGDSFGVPLQPVELGDYDSLARAFAVARPDVVLHAGAMARIAECHRDPERARRINRDGSAVLAELTAQTGARLVLVSTDLVFDGERGNYREDDPVRPLSIYGQTKVAAEEAVLPTPRAAVARMSLLIGPSLCGRPSFFDEQVAALCGGRSVTLFTDEWRTPLDLPTAARALVALAQSDYTGVIHISGPERLSRLEMGQRLATALGTGAHGIVAATRDQAPAPEPRPRDTSLDSSRWRRLFPEASCPGHDDVLREMLARV